MRPRKRILLIAYSTSLQEQYTLILQTWGYTTITVQQHEQRPCELSAVLTVALPMHTLAPLTLEHHSLPLVAYVAREMDRSTATRMGAQLTAADHYVLREQVRPATARKRGPKPASSATALPAQMERAA